jgi:hypothetical protein
MVELLDLQKILQSQPYKIHRLKLNLDIAALWCFFAALIFPGDHPLAYPHDLEAIAGCIAALDCQHLQNLEGSHHAPGIFGAIDITRLDK